MEGWTEVSKVPTAGKGYKDAVEEFYASGLSCVKRDFGDDVSRAYTAMRRAADKDGIPVRVTKRGTTIYLKREQ